MFRRLLAALLLIVGAAAVLLLGWPQLFSLQRAPGVTQLVSFRAAGAAGGVVILLFLLVLAAANPRFRRLGLSLSALALVFVLLNAAVLSSRGFGGGALPARAGADVTVVSWNTLGGAPGAAVIAQLAIESDADIVSLPETTEQTATAVAVLMTAAGIPMVSHTVAHGHISKSRSTSVLISTALGAYHLDESAGSTGTLPSLVMVPDSGSGPTIVAAHPVAPQPTELENWRSDLHWIAGACPDGNVIIAGDFNSTLDHLAGLGTAPGTTVGACTDAALRTHSAAVGTWPTFAPALLGAPIDHVMTTANWSIVGVHVVENLDRAGSDHRPIVVRLRPTR
ncbi:endonuclease/exonuclease/phosphatase family protein [Lacisediminihabitans sp. H27-G8]|uniref:endonuclease/exonuclease/phosphatase family protein n=1 Tax=Lacisediminihabitans sp. H27-G8 TaxID=3111909 RepID=UPI0038FC6F26